MKRFIGLLLLVGIFSLISINSLAANADNSNDKEKLHILLFYSKHCGACMKVENEILPPLLKKYGDRIDLTQKEISEKGVIEELVQYNEKSSVPTMVVAGQILVGSDKIEEKLEGIIKDFIAGKIKNNSIAPPEAKKKQ